MKIKGELCLSYDKDDYIVFSNGRMVNLTDKLNVMLLEDVKLIVKDMYDGKILINVEGRLYKNKVQPKYYLYYIDETDIDSILWNLVGGKLEIDLVNVSKR